VARLGGADAEALRHRARTGDRNAMCPGELYGQSFLRVSVDEVVGFDVGIGRFAPSRTRQRGWLEVCISLHAN
jgi:hypothetical protein